MPDEDEEGGRVISPERLGRRREGGEARKVGYWLWRLHPIRQRDRDPVCCLFSLRHPHQAELPPDNQSDGALNDGDITAVCCTTCLG